MPESIPLKRFEFERIKMAVPVRIVLYTETESLAESCAEAGYKRFDEINASMSDYDLSSEIHRLTADNDQRLLKDSCCDDGWREVSDDLFAVMQAARHHAEISDGAFDVTISPLVQLWRRAKRLRKLPSRDEVEKARSLVGSYLWELDDAENEKRVRLHKAGMRFDFGGIAKGYAIDQAFEAVQKQGIQSVLIDAGGDMRLGDAPPEKDGWSVGIQGREDDKNRTLSNISSATSGDTFQFFELEGVRYSHIINPKTGWPLADSFIVTICSVMATEADALASAVSVLGPEKGIALIDRIPGTEAMVLRRSNPTTVYRSKLWKD